MDTLIYLLVQNGVPLYVGRSRTPERRFYSHLKALKDRNHHSHTLQSAYNDSIPMQMHELEWCSSDVAELRELFWYDHYVSLGYDLKQKNPKNGFWKSGNLRMTEEHKKRISVANTGKHHHQLTKQRISQKLKGRETSQETRKKLASSLSEKSDRYSVIEWLEQDLTRCFLGSKKIEELANTTRGVVQWAIGIVIKKHRIVRPITPQDYDKQVPFEGKIRRKGKGNAEKT